MNLLFVVNPTASAVRYQHRVQVEDVLAAEHQLAVAVTEGRGHATELAREAVASGVEVVVAMGGDGTFNEAANGLVGSSTALATIPAGSTNVYCRTIGFTNDPVEAAREVVAALRSGSRRRVEMGRANDRYYLFHLGVGFDAEVVERVEAMGNIKRRLGQGAFVYAAVAKWVAHPQRGDPWFSVRFDDGSVHEGSLALCLKTNPYTFLGKRPLDVAPETGLGTPLAVAVVHDLRLATIGKAFRSTLGGGRDLDRQPGVTVRTSVESVTITASRPFPHQVDGDYLGPVDNLEVSYERSCLDLVVPRGS